MATSGAIRSISGLDTLASFNPRKTKMEIDPYTIRHLDAWLENQINGDTLRDKVRTAMLTFISNDPEYWGSQEWWNVFDRAKCHDIFRLHIERPTI
jgi:hypothetical protein